MTKVSPEEHPILAAMESCGPARELADQLPGLGEVATLKGVVGSSAAAVIGFLARRHPGRVLVAVGETPAGARSLEADLETLLGSGTAFLYPQRESLPYESGEPHLEIGGLRIEAVEALFTGRARILVTTTRALQERSSIPRSLADLRITLSRGQAPGFRTFVDALRTRGFEEVPLVEEVGQFAVRGGILDVYSFGSPEPLRVEFWGDEVASIRHFDILDQRSTREVDHVHLLPVDFAVEGEAQHVRRSLLELLPGEPLLVFLGEEHWPQQVQRTWEEVRRLHAQLQRRGRTPPPPDDLFLAPEPFRQYLEVCPRLYLYEVGAKGPSLGAQPPPDIARDMQELRRTLVAGVASGHRILVLCDNDGQVERLEEILEASGGIPPGVRVGVGSVEGGFFLETAAPPILVLTDHEIFRRSRRLRRGRRFRGAVALESVSQLTPGDYVVHMEHGVGVFQGLERVRVGGEEIEGMVIEYAEGERLRVPVYRLDLVERWVGETEESRPPQIHRIGGRRWKGLRKKTERAIENMARDLLELYARREAARGFSFAPDTRWQKEMESSFLYEDTPDQRKATEDVKRDMESPRPMDRLICGDVGYGKTEVAIRAAFKAVQDGKQVAVLAPTTILVEQHRHTFEERLADYPVRIGTLSRFRTQTERAEILRGLARGSFDIVIGTHRLLSGDVSFANLGLLVVDEEQRFGVQHKERLKDLRSSVDVLTLTATPIPRTLNQSMVGIRDITLIQTPPRDRVPVITHVLPWSGQIIAEALHREVDRGGQIYFLHNRVETILTAAERVQRLAPEARIGVAHGKMPPRKLDEVMTAFVDGQLDVLVSSSIIENGLDVPNANTLIVDRADNFGLAQLYQIRGRVGRSDRRAYAYLIMPDEITEDAERRLRVLEHYSELGSGYAVALRDLELRGSGNLLGREQSGFVQAVGLDTYLRLLENTVRRIGEGLAQTARVFPAPEVSVAGPAYLPDAYVGDPGQKLHIYRRLSKLESQAAVAELGRELTDRFGAPPQEVWRVLHTQSLRLLGRKLGIERILVGEDEGRLTFRADAEPRLQVLEKPLLEGLVEVVVRRLAPLSIVLRRGGPVDMVATLVQALTVLAEEGNSPQPQKEIVTGAASGSGPRQLESN